MNDESLASLTRPIYIALLGEPATGKTSLVRSLLARTVLDGPPMPFKHGLAKGTQHAGGRFILGEYPPGETFGGTDKLSMTVIDSAEELAEVVYTLGGLLLFEGDRLANARFLDHLDRLGELVIIRLLADDETLDQRHADRGDTQSATWLAGRKTKLDNLLRDRDHLALPNVLPTHYANNEELLWKLWMQ